MAEILFREESYKIIGACFEVYKNKGCGFSEAIYQECLSIEFGLQGIPFAAQPIWNSNIKARNSFRHSGLISSASTLFSSRSKHFRN